MAQETTDFAAQVESNAGALPSLDDAQVLGEPTTRMRSKSNVSKLTVMGMLMVAFLFIIFGLLIWQKNRSASVNGASTTVAAVKPKYEEKNEILDSAAIARQKAELKQKEAEEKAAKDAAEADARQRAERAQQEQAEAERMARLSAQRTGPAMAASGPPGGYGGTGPASAANGPVPAAPPSPQDRKMQGGVLLASTGAKIKPEGQLSEKEQKEREFNSRMNAMGHGPNSAAGAGPAAAGGGGGGMFAGGAGNGPGAGGSGGGPGGGSGGGDSLAGRLQPTTLQARTAGRLPNLNFLLKKGTTIPCALNTGINTTLPGFVTCKALNDIYSANGKTLLVERGATFFGEQQSNIKEGQERTLILWTRVDNPNGVFANIDSPATDQMGYSGVPGYVETYFWKRFGGAIMLSLIKDFSGAYARKLAQDKSGDGSGNTNSYNSTQQATNDMAGIALRNTINIPPTLIVLPGTVVNVMVARDVSFENVYNLAD